MLSRELVMLGLVEFNFHSKIGPVVSLSLQICT